MATSHEHMQFVKLRRLAMARAAFALLANSEDQEGVLKVMNAEPGCRAAAGLTAGQEASMLAAVNSDQFSAQAAADVVSDIIATNHGEDGLAAVNIDLIDMLRRIERRAHLDEERIAALIREKPRTLEEKAAMSSAVASQAIFQLGQISRMVAPLLELLDTQAHVAGQSYPEAAE